MHINALQILLERRFPALAQNTRSIPYLQELLALYDIAFDEGYAEGDQDLDDSRDYAAEELQDEVDRLGEQIWELECDKRDLQGRLNIAVQRFEKQKEIADTLRGTRT